MRQVKEIYAIPMWLNGRVYLKLSQDYRDVVNPLNGEVLRKVALFGPEEVDEALRSAGHGLAAWWALGESGHTRLLASLGDALYDLRAHFSRLIADETGKDEESATRDVIKLVSCLREPQAASVTGVVALFADAKELQAVVAQAVSTLAAGAVLVVCPSPQSPSALFALAELSGRCGFPAGVINVACLGDEGRACLQEAPGITMLP